jgi:pantoate--beta-alanine ligase
VIEVTTAVELRHALAAVRRSGRAIALVPTMGFLHEGHLSLADVARDHADFVVLSIYVNPLQFGPGEDLDRYPRDPRRDAALARERGVDALYLPDDAQMYPDGEPAVIIDAPDLTTRLCGAFRPGHFRGVLTVVAKLFNQVRPDAAVFGRKDFQQLALVSRMARDLDMGIEIVGAPIVRESDGLAMSSRNVFLGPAERADAALLNRALQEGQAAFTAGSREPADIVGAVTRRLATSANIRPQYVELVDARTLASARRAEPGQVLALAVLIGSTRLIDNHTLTAASAEPVP